MHENEIKNNLVNNNQYFGEGLKWHNFKFHYIFLERLWLLILAIALILPISVVITNINALLPLKTRVPFVHYADNIDDEVPIITNLYDIYKGEKDLQSVVDEYFVSRYVYAWNNLNKEDQEYNRAFIKSHSSYKVYSAFLHSKNNSIKKDASSARIIKTSIRKDLDTTVKKVELKLQQDVGNKIKVVKLSFRSSDILLAYKKIVPLEFIVVDYEEL